MIIYQFFEKEFGEQFTNVIVKLTKEKTNENG